MERNLEPNLPEAGGGASWGWGRQGRRRDSLWGVAFCGGSLTPNMTDTLSPVASSIQSSGAVQELGWMCSPCREAPKPEASLLFWTLCTLRAYASLPPLHRPFLRLPPICRWIMWSRHATASFRPGEEPTRCSLWMRWLMFQVSGGISQD